MILIRKHHNKKEIIKEIFSIFILFDKKNILVSSKQWFGRYSMNSDFWFLINKHHFCK